MTYDWFKERELERIHGNSDFRFAASLFLYSGEHRTDPGLKAALTYAADTAPGDVRSARTWPGWHQASVSAS